MRAVDMTANRRRAPLLATGGLLLNTLVWGLSFVLVKDALAHIGAIDFILIRFAVAGVVLGGAGLLRDGRRGSLKRSKRSEARAGTGTGGVAAGATVAAALWPGLPAGLALLGGYLLQTFGLRYTSAAKAGFITGLCVVLVPPLAWLVAGEPLRRRAVIALPLAVAGLALLSGGGADAGGGLLRAPSGGDLLVLGCAACFALQIALLARLAHPAESRRGVDPLLLTLWQVLTVTAGAALLLPLAGGASGTPAAWGAAVFLGVAGTAGAYLVQTLAQTHVTGTRTALIYTAEPLFAVLFAALLAGEHLSFTTGLGGACTVVAMLLGG